MKSPNVIRTVALNLIVPRVAETPITCPNQFKQASHGLRGSVSLKMPIHAHFFQQAILTCKVGHIDLVFGVPSGFVSRSARARLQVSVCGGYD